MTIARMLAGSLATAIGAAIGTYILTNDNEVMRFDCSEEMKSKMAETDYITVERTPNGTVMKGHYKSNK